MEVTEVQRLRLEGWPDDAIADYFGVAVLDLPLERDVGRVIQTHQTEVSEARFRVMSLFRQLDTETALVARVDMASKLTTALSRLVELERRVYGIKDDVGETDLVRALKELADAHH